MVRRSYETYRMQLLKSKYMELTKDFTAEEKKFFPSLIYLGIPFYFTPYNWSTVASQRLSGWDEKDPNNLVMWREPNCSLMRSEFSPTNREKGTMSSAHGHKLVPDEIMRDMAPGFPLQEDKRPTKRKKNEKERGMSPVSRLCLRNRFVDVVLRHYRRFMSYVVSSIFFFSSPYHYYYFFLLQSS